MTREQLIQNATERTAKYPQYKGHYDGYLLATILRNVKTKGGQAFLKGETVIYDPATVEVITDSYTKSYNGKHSCTAWSLGLGWNVSLIIGVHIKLVETKQ